MGNTQQMLEHKMHYRTGGVMVFMFAPSAVDRGFEQQSG